MIPESAPVLPPSETLLPTPLASRPFARALRYILRRVLVIFLTIVAGVFITVVVANRGGLLDRIARDGVNAEIRQLQFQGRIAPNQIEPFRSQMETALGVSLPFWPKHLLYTYRALTLSWGDVSNRSIFSMYIETLSGKVQVYDSRTIILAQLPNTLLLSGCAYLLLMLIGIPLALFLSQHEGRWFDRLTAILTPVSSVPSWVIGILLVMLFAVQFHLFPVAKMISPPPPETSWERIVQIAYHLVLPVAAIVLSLIFQLVNNWRTFLLIYSEEDYVDLGRAKGLSERVVQRRYILRPVLPYLLTGLALSLAGFWQTITALEYFFDWPGIGNLYVQALPNFKGESIYPGEMSIMVGIVVLFAYLLGLTVFVLDFVYVLVDPRLRLGEEEPRLFAASLGKQSLWSRVKALLQRRRAEPILRRKRLKLRLPLKEWGDALRQAGASAKQLQRELVRSPGAVVGLSLITVLVLGSIAVMIFLPYQSIGRQWEASAVTANPVKARLGLPKWLNWFRQNDLPSTIVLDSRAGGVMKRAALTSDQGSTVQLEFTFEYPYKEFPSDIALYVHSQYAEKTPFLSLTWITPDTRVIKLKDTSTSREMTYSLSEIGNVPYRRELEAHKNWKAWFITSGNYPTSAFYLLMADPNASQARALPGLYTLRVDGTFFEPGGDLEAELVVFGRVEGWAGTDNLRRDLAVPLLWGLPIALAVGSIGAIATTLLSILIAAAGAWFGGWVDALIQRAIEASLILPVLAIGVIFNAYYGFNLWLILGLMVLINVLGSPTKSFRAAFLQVKSADYIEAARVYGASNWRIIRSYLIPRILPVVIPQIVTLVPNFFFLEATLAIFNISDPRYPTWGRVIYDGLRYGAAYGSRFWVLEPIALMLLTGLSFVLLGFALNRILNPRLREV